MKSPERRHPCPICGPSKVTILPPIREAQPPVSGKHEEKHLNGVCEKGHELWRHGAEDDYVPEAVNWYEDWERAERRCRCPLS